MISMPSPSTILVLRGKEAPSDGYEAYGVETLLAVPWLTPLGW